MASPFDILGIEPDADDEEVIRAYRERVKEAHPDHGGTPSEFRKVRTAYERIKAGDVGELEDADGQGEQTGRGRPTADHWRTSRQDGRVRRGDREKPSQVEYLDYEVIEERGWSLADDDLFEKAADTDLDSADYGRFLVQPHESLLEAAENRGFAWPFACRGGACANCAVAVVEGDLSMPVDHILSDVWMDRGIRLSCNGVPTTDEMKVVYNVKRLPGLDELRLPPHPFKQAHSD